MNGKTELILISAIGKHGVIGIENRLPWRLKADLQRFKNLTTGCPVIMGRKTWESLGRPLPGRHNMVISRNRNYRAEGAHVVASLDDAVRKCADAPRIFVIGGAQIYAMALPIADALELTEVDASIQGDAFFPEFDRKQYIEIFREHHQADADNDHAFDFVTYRRKR
ncbi:MAG: dihydrofolate reductase [Rhodocyclaceae bacterium]